MITQEKRKNIKFSAVILAAGSGSRMKSDLPKQYMPLCGRPLITYAIDAFAEGDIDEIVLVCTPGDKDYMQDEILGRYCEEAGRKHPVRVLARRPGASGSPRACCGLVLIQRKPFHLQT